MSSLNFDFKKKRKRFGKDNKKNILQKNNPNGRDAKAALEAKRLLEIAAERRKAEEEQKKSNNRKQKLEEALQQRETGGVDVCMKLYATPISKINSNKVILPPSFLAKLVENNVLDKRDLNRTPVCVEISLEGNENTVFAGVDEFSAEENVIGLPPKTALSLCQSFDYLSLSEPLTVRYIELPNYSSLLIKLRPKGSGFFVNNEVVDIDIEKVLEKTLNSHVTIALNDIIPVVSKEKIYLLVVEEVIPSDNTNIEEIIELEDDFNTQDLDIVDKEELFIEYKPRAFVLLNNEIKLDILPSEYDQVELDKEKLEADLIAKVVYRFKDIVETYEKQEKNQNNGSFAFKVRLPDGSSVMNKFSKESLVENVLQWMNYCLANSSVDLSNCDLSKTVLEKYPFILTQPRNKTFIDLRKANIYTKTIETIGLPKANLYVLTMIPKGESKEKQEKIERIEPSIWYDSYLQIGKEKLVETFETVIELKQETVVVDVDRIEETYSQLVDVFGIDSVVARKAAEQYTNSIEQLKEMGFESRIPDIIPLLFKYQGRVVRVANALVGNG